MVCVEVKKVYNDFVHGLPLRLKALTVPEKGRGGRFYMSRKEVVLAAINHHKTEVVPYTIGFTQQAYEKVARYLGDPDFIEKIGNYIDMIDYSGNPTEMQPGSGYFKDDFGVIWNRNGTDKEIGVIDDIVLKEPTLKGYAFPSIDEDLLRERLKELVNNGHDTFKIAGIGFCMFERAWTLRGMENLLVDMILNPDFVDELLDTITEFNLYVMDIILDYNIDGFYFGDDWGQQRGLIMGPKLWRRFIKPRMARLYKKAHDAGKYVVQHSCGDIHELFPDLIEIGLDVYNTFQPEIYNVREIKTLYGDKLTFWGGISTQQVLPFASPDEVKKVARYMMKIMSYNGGYIAAPTHAIPGDVPPENIVALIEVFKNQSYEINVANMV